MNKSSLCIQGDQCTQLSTSSNFIRALEQKEELEKVEEDNLDDDSDDDKQSQVNESRILPSFKDSAIVVPKNSDTFGEINVDNSRNVNFGSRTFFKGQITINQIHHTQENANGFLEGRLPLKDVIKVDVKKHPESDSGNFDGSCSSKKKLAKKWWEMKKIAISLCGAAMLLTLTSTIFILIHTGGNKIDEKDLNSSMTTTSKNMKPTLAPSTTTIKDITDSTTSTSTSSTAASDDDLPVVKRSEWNTEEFDHYKRIKLDKPEYVIICDTRDKSDNCFNKNHCIYRVQRLQRYNRKYDRSDILYNFLVGGDGNIYEGQGWKFGGNHTTGYNNTSIGIAFLGSFTDQEPSMNQVEAAKKLVDYSFEMNKVAKDYKLVGQNQVKETSSPGSSIRKIIEKWPHWVMKP